MSYNLPFQPRQDSASLSEQDLFLFKVAKWIQILSALVCISALCSLAVYYFYLRAKPSWSVEPLSPQALKIEVEAYEAERKAYVETIDLLNQRIRLDLVAAPLLYPTPSGIQLDDISYKTTYLDSGLGAMLLINGLSTENDTRPIQQYLSGIRNNLARYLPGRQISVVLQQSKIDKRTGYLLFSFRVQIE